MRFVRTTDAATEPITTSEAKTHLRITMSDEDTYIDTLIQAARELAEEIAESSFITQTWKAYLDDFESCIQLRWMPIISITSVKYRDSDGDEQTVTSSNYNADAISGRVTAIDSWPEHNTDYKSGVVIEYQAGYGAASAVPKKLNKLLK